jgi:hypothetical protein
MITAIVQFSLPKPISLEEAARAFESTAPKYQVQTLEQTNGKRIPNT